MSQDTYKDALKALLKYHPMEEDLSPTDPPPPAREYGPELLDLYKKFFLRCGHKLDELSKLNTIHMAGTKGKGSVSAMCESILRRYGLKTGLLTSPHLIEVRERMQINGQFLTQDQFSGYFWECFNKLDSSKDDEDDMPSYYQFFTFMAFHVFLREEVDVAIIEVVKGGAFDTTNILINPWACGITLMDMDHTDILGDTLEKITWHKARIAKPGSPMVIFPQKPGPLKVIVEQAREAGVSSLEITPELAEYSPKDIAIGLRGEHNKLNASLAAQLCRKWLIAKGMWDGQSQSQDTDEETKGIDDYVPLASSFELPEKFLTGLKLCSWPGRSQIEKRNGVTFYLDAAHTPLSIQACAKWFKNEADEEAKTLKANSKVMMVLLFNFLGCRDPYALLTPLLGYDFDYALFAPSFTGGDGTNTLDQANQRESQATLDKKSLLSEQVWQQLHSQKTTPGLTQNGLNSNEHLISSSQTRKQRKPLKTKIFPSIDHAIEWACRGRDLSVKSTAPEKLSEVDPTPDDLKSATHLQVFVTGSARLIGITMYTLGISI